MTTVKVKDRLIHARLTSKVQAPRPHSPSHVAQVNYYAHALLTLGLLDRLRSTPGCARGKTGYLQVPLLLHQPAEAEGWMPCGSK